MTCKQWVELLTSLTADLLADFVLGIKHPHLMNNAVELYIDTTSQ